MIRDTENFESIEILKNIKILGNIENEVESKVENYGKNWKSMKLLKKSSSWDIYFENYWLIYLTCWLYISHLGTNWYDRASNLVYFIVKGPGGLNTGHVEVRLAPEIFVTFK